MFLQEHILQRRAKNGVDPSKNLQILTHEQILFILNLDNISEKKNEAFIINTRLSQFYAQNWESFRSWTISQPNIYENRETNVIYTDRNIQILTSKS